MTLYDLTNEALALNAALENEGFSDEERMSAMATYLAGAPVDKIEAYAKLIRTIEADQDAYKAEEQVFKAKRQACENKVTWLKAGLKAFFETTGCEFVKTPLFKVALQKNAAPTCEVDDVAALPDYLKRVSVEAEKKLITERIKNGEDIPGCRLIYGAHVSIR